MFLISFSDIDECLSASICNNGICLNSDGSYSCTACPTGYLVSSDGELCAGLHVVLCCWHLTLTVLSFGPIFFFIICLLGFTGF